MDDRFQTTSSVLERNPSNMIPGTEIRGYLDECEQRIVTIGTIKWEELTSTNNFPDAKEPKKQRISNEILEPIFKRDYTRPEFRPANLTDLDGILSQIHKTIRGLKQELVTQYFIQRTKIESLISHLTAVRYYLWYFNKNSVYVSRVFDNIDPLIENGAKFISTYKISDKPVGDGTTKQAEADILTNEIKSYQEQFFLNQNENFEIFLRQLWELSLSHHSIHKRIFISYAWPVEGWHSLYLLNEDKDLTEFDRNEAKEKGFYLVLVGKNQRRKVFFYMEGKLLKSGHETVVTNIELSEQEAAYLSPQKISVVPLKSIPENMPTLNDKIFHLTEGSTKKFVSLLALHLVYAGFIVYHDLITESGDSLNNHMDRILYDTDIVLVISTRTYAYKIKNSSTGVSHEYGKILERKKQKKPLVVIPVLLNEKNYCQGDLHQRVEERFNNRYVEPLRRLLTRLYEFSPIPQSEAQKYMLTLFEEFIYKQEIVSHAKELITTLRPDEEIPEKLKRNFKEVKELINRYKTLILRKDALENAMQHGSIEVIILLLTVVDIAKNEFNERKLTVFCLAAHYDRYDVLDFLFRHFPVGLLDENKDSDETPAHVAVKKDHLNSLKIILAYAPGMIDLKDARGNSLLHYATEHNAAKCALYLGKHVKDLKETNNDGLSALEGEKNASLKERVFVEREKRRREKSHGMPTQHEILMQKYHQDKKYHINVLLGESALSVKEYVKCELLFYYFNISGQGLSLPFAEQIEKIISEQKKNKDILALYATQYIFSWDCNDICNFDLINAITEDNKWGVEKELSGLKNTEGLEKIKGKNEIELNEILTLLFNVCVLSTDNFSEGLTAACWAAKYNSVRVLKLLHKTCPAELEIVDISTGENLLHIAAKNGRCGNGNYKALEYLLTVLPQSMQDARGPGNLTYLQLKAENEKKQEFDKTRTLPNEKVRKRNKVHVEKREDDVPEIMKRRGTRTESGFREEQTQALERYKKRPNEEEVSDNISDEESDLAKRRKLEKVKKEDVETTTKVGIYAHTRSNSTTTKKRKQYSDTSFSLKQHH